MRFEPKSEKEIAEANLWPAGEYDFEITEAAEEVSKKGNDMVHLQVTIYNQDGNSRRVDDYLVSTNEAAFKLRQFAESVGLLTQYEGGEITADEMIGRAGRCKVIVKKDNTGQYADKNAIGAYLKPKAAQQKANGGAARPTTLAQDLSDDIPFVSFETDENLLLRKKLSL